LFSLVFPRKRFKIYIGSYRFHETKNENVYHLSLIRGIVITTKESEQIMKTFFHHQLNTFVAGSLAETNENQYEESGKRSVLTDFSFCQIL